MCRSLMLNTALLLFAGVLPKMILCMPVQGSNEYHGGVMPGPVQNGAQCVSIPEDHYCAQFAQSDGGNRTTAFFPNPRGHKTFAEANAEFSDFISLLKSSCHPKLGTLLCFIYFPFCESAYPGIRVYPCRELCEEVHDSNCTMLVEAYAGKWNNQLQCNESHYKPKASGCVDGIAPAYPGSRPMTTEVPTTPSTEVPTTESGSRPMTTEVPTTPSAEVPTTESAVCGNDACPSECDYRENANSGTFKRNGYCYAARVTVKSHKYQDCQHTYTLEVKDQFDLQTPFNRTHSTKAPAMGDSVVILTSPSHCPQCPKLETSQTYLISGSYRRAADGTVQWNLEGVDNKALVSSWIPRYDRKLDIFISRGNTYRKQQAINSATIPFVQMCEGDSQMVSAEQWIEHQI